MTTGTPDREDARAPADDGAAPADGAAGDHAEGGGAGAEGEQAPLEALREAASAGQSDETWTAYGALTASDKRALRADDELLTSTATALGSPKAGELLTDVGITPRKQIEIAAAANVLTRAVFDAIVAPLATHEVRGLVTDDPTVDRIMAAGELSGQHPTVLLVDFCAAGTQLASACYRSQKFFEWMMTDTDAFEAAVEAASANKRDFVQAFDKREVWEPLLRIAGRSADGWQSEVGAFYFKRMLAKVARPIPNVGGDDHIGKGVLALYGDGAGIPVATKRETFAALYTATLRDASAGDYRTGSGSEADLGQDGRDALGIVVPAGTVISEDWERWWNTVAPDGDAMDLLFQQFTTIPRTHVNLSDGVFFNSKNWYSVVLHVPAVGADAAYDVNAYWLSANNSYTSSAADGVIETDTSYYLGNNWIAMRALNTAGAVDGVDDIGDTTYVDAAGDYQDTPYAVADRHTDPTDASQTERMSIFENHATHEVGHAVGARTFSYNRGGATVGPLGGNAWAEDYGAWTHEGAAGDASPREKWAAQFGWNKAAWDAKAYKLTKDDGTEVDTTGLEIRDWFCDFAESPPRAASGALGTKFGEDNAAVRAALAGYAGGDPDFSSLGLMGRVRYSPDNQFRFRDGFDSNPDNKVWLWCTRTSGGAWASYSVDNYYQQVSEYSLSSVGEMFAELYTAWFTGNKSLPTLNGKNAVEFFTALEHAEPGDFTGNVGDGDASFGPTAGADAGASLPSELEGQGGPEGAGEGGGGAATTPATTPPLDVPSERPFGGSGT